MPDNCICYIDDIVIPVSWSTIDVRNTKMYMYVQFVDNALYKVITIPKQNYTGSTFVEALGIAINDAWYTDWNLRFDVLYDLSDNLLSIVHFKLL